MNETAVAANFCLYSKSLSFDYSWVFALDDNAQQSSLNELVVRQFKMNTDQPGSGFKLFAQIGQFVALAAAKVSATRRDGVSRPIRERGAYVWPLHSPISYGHLLNMTQSLEAEMEKAVGDLPDDQALPPRRSRPITLQRSDCEGWGETNALTPTELQNILARKLTVLLPTNSSFAEAIQLLGNARIGPGTLVRIAIGIEDATPDAFHSGAWIRTPLGNEAALFQQRAADLLILDKRGEIMERENLRTSPAVLNRDKPSTRELRAEQGNEDEGVPMPFLPEKSIAELSGAITERAQEWSRVHGNQNGALLRRIRSSFRSNERELVQCSYRLSLLIETALGIVPSDIAYSWTMLLREIELFYAAPSDGVDEEWIRRLTKIMRITQTHLVKRANREWLSEVASCCDRLQTLLIDCRNAEGGAGSRNT